MKKTELHDMVFETLNNYITESDLSVDKNKFSIGVDVSNKDSETKEGIRITLMPKNPIAKLQDEEDLDQIKEKVQDAFNLALRPYDMIANLDPDTYAIEQKNVIRLYIPIDQIKSFLVQAIKNRSQGD